MDIQLFCTGYTSPGCDTLSMYSLERISTNDGLTIRWIGRDGSGLVRIISPSNFVIVVFTPAVIIQTSQWTKKSRRRFEKEKFSYQLSSLLWEFLDEMFEIISIWYYILSHFQWQISPMMVAGISFNESWMMIMGLTHSILTFSNE